MRFIALLVVLLSLTASMYAQTPRRRPAASMPSKDSVMVDLKKQVFLESAVEVRPEIVSGPPVVYPDLLRQAGVEGRVVVELIVDTLGHAVPGSLKIVASPNEGFDQSARDYVLGAVFRPARIHGRAVYVLVNVPLDYKIRRKTP